MLPPPDSGPAVVSARPDALQRFAADAGRRTTGLEAAISRVDVAVARWNAAPCDPQFAVHIPPPTGQITALATQWTLTDNFVAEVAAAFVRADFASSGGVSYADPAALNKAMQTAPNYNPMANLQKDDPALWHRLTDANVCFSNGGKYGGGGFIIGPDGRKYPLVIPMLPGKDGKIYNADDGGAGNVNTLDGRDPGWFTVGVYTGKRPLYKADTTDAMVGGALIGITGGQAPTSNAASPSDYAGLNILGNGRPTWTGDKGHIAPPSERGIDKMEGPKGGPPPEETRGTAGAGAAMFALNTVNNVAGAKSDAEARAYGAYRLVLERNVDGRVRAQLTQFAMAKNPKDNSRVIAPIGVSVDGKGVVQGTVIHYRPHVEPTTPHAEPKGNGDYHIYDHTKADHSFFADPDHPYKQVYQDH